MEGIFDGMDHTPILYMVVPTFSAVFKLWKGIKLIIYALTWLWQFGRKLWPVFQRSKLFENFWLSFSLKLFLNLFRKFIDKIGNFKNGLKKLSCRLVKRCISSLFILIYPQKKNASLTKPFSYIAHNICICYIKIFIRCSLIEKFDFEIWNIIFFIFCLTHNC